ncbi:hypothetical protein CEXT_277721 [Caerostris extrusa]|uniref:Uncharacterized protein n=1 Tax=Caerostris extrusa TaxID=172846 RepID=A0AAV4NG50_CAEEX|nr:hypothetical protein CEXT_277721 [Caerostris extrusa]
MSSENRLNPLDSELNNTVVRSILLRFCLLVRSRFNMEFGFLYLFLTKRFLSFSLPGNRKCVWNPRSTVSRLEQRLLSESWALLPDFGMPHSLVQTEKRLRNAGNALLINGRPAFSNTPANKECGDLCVVDSSTCDSLDHNKYKSGLVEFPARKRTPQRVH